MYTSYYKQQGGFSHLEDTDISKIPVILQNKISDNSQDFQIRKLKTRNSHSLNGKMQWINTEAISQIYVMND